jgi:hypothetical protein
MIIEHTECDKYVVLAILTAHVKRRREWIRLELNRCFYDIRAPLSMDSTAHSDRIQLWITNANNK